MPLPGEIRIINGVPYTWVPKPQLRNRTKKTHNDYRNNFYVKGTESIFRLEGTGEIREVVVVSDKSMSLDLTVDGNSFFGKIASWDELAGISINSDSIDVRFDDPKYIINISKIFFSKFIDLTVICDSTTIIHTVMATYDRWENG